MLTFDTSFFVDKDGTMDFNRRNSAFRAYLRYFFTTFWPACNCWKSICLLTQWSKMIQIVHSKLELIFKRFIKVLFFWTLTFYSHFLSWSGNSFLKWDFCLENFLNLRRYPVTQNWMSKRNPEFWRFCLRRI